jgi:HD-GYP domain
MKKAVAAGILQQNSDITPEEAFLSGLLHDIGKISIPDEVLKSPQKLTSQQFVVVSRHPLESYRTLFKEKYSCNICLAVYQHPRTLRRLRISTWVKSQFYFTTGKTSGYRRFLLCYHRAAPLQTSSKLYSSDASFAKRFN